MELKEYKLGDLIEVTRGMSLPGEFYSTEGEYIRLTCGNFDYVNNSFKENKSKDDLYYVGKIKPEFIMEKGDIITPLTEQAIGLLGSTAIIPESGKYIQSQDVAKVTCKKGMIDHDFAYYLIPSKCVKEQLSAAAQQTKIRHTSPDAIKACKVFIPPLSEQKKIASVLSALDDKIALNKKMNQKLEAMAKRLYDYWFVQFDFPDKNGHPYKTTGGLMTYNPTLKREIPAGWEVSFVSDVIKPIDRGISYTSEEIKDSSGIPMINLACFDKKGNYRTGELKFYSGEYDESNKVYPLDILIACTDLTQKADIIGTPIFLSAEAPFYVFSTDLAKITPKNEFHKYFLYYYLKNPTFHRYIKPFASGTTVKHLNVKGVENYPIFIPDEKVVKQFTETVRPMVIAINERINEINRLTALRNKLLPLLMNGQVEVG